MTKAAIYSIRPWPKGCSRSGRREESLALSSQLDGEQQQVARDADRAGKHAVALADLLVLCILRVGDECLDEQADHRPSPAFL